MLRFFYVPPKTLGLAAILQRFCQPCRIPNGVAFCCMLNSACSGGKWFRHSLYDNKRVSSICDSLRLAIGDGDGAPRRETLGVFVFSLDASRFASYVSRFGGKGHMRTVVRSMFFRLVRPMLFLPMLVFSQVLFNVGAIFGYVDYQLEERRAHSAIAASDAVVTVFTRTGLDR